MRADSCPRPTRLYVWGGLHFTWHLCGGNIQVCRCFACSGTGIDNSWPRRSRTPLFKDMLHPLVCIFDSYYTMMDLKDCWLWNFVSHSPDLNPIEQLWQASHKKSFEPGAIQWDCLSNTLHGNCNSFKILCTK